MSNPEKAWTPEFSIDRKLIGPLPEIVDLTNYNLRLDYSEKSIMVIEGDSNVKSITLPCDVVGVNHLEISNLEALEELHLIGESSGFMESYQWVTISNTPSLRRVCLNGDVCSLSIKAAPSLIYLDASGCPGLDYASFIDPPAELKVNVSGCLKLKKIIGITERLKNDSGLTVQIENNQRNSLNDGSIYESMTYTDIELVERIINEGVKALSRKRIISSDNGSILGLYDLMAFDPDFKPYSYRILEPLEPVYTGGTGETYPYVFMESSVDVDDLAISVDDGAGNTSPEECISYMLHWTRMGISKLPYLKESSDEELLDFLKNMAESKYFEGNQEMMVFFSRHIDPVDVQILSDLSNKTGIRLNNEKTEEYIYIHPDSGVPEDENDKNWEAKISTPLYKAKKQLLWLENLFMRINK